MFMFKMTLEEITKICLNNFTQNSVPGLRWHWLEMYICKHRSQAGNNETVWRIHVLMTDNVE